MHLNGIGSFKKLLMSFVRGLIVRKSMHSRFNDVTSDTFGLRLALFTHISYKKSA